MAYRIEGGYACSYCGKIYKDDIEADICRESHEVVYIQLSRTELNRLLLFIFQPDEKLMSEALVKKLQRYARVASRDN